MIWQRIACIVIGYVFGLFQTAFIIGKMHNIDIREYGIGNSGTTNAMRTLGKKYGFITYFGDALKAVFAVILTYFLFRNQCEGRMMVMALYTGLGTILGHNFPFYLNFRGGKGFAASVGFMLIFDYKIFFVCAVVFIAIFFLTHYVSLGSLSAYVTALIAMILRGQGGAYGMDKNHVLEMYILMILLTALAFYKHRSNIVRLLHGNESRIYLRRKK